MGRGSYCVARKKGADGALRAQKAVVGQRHSWREEKKGKEGRGLPYGTTPEKGREE